MLLQSVVIILFCCRRKLGILNVLLKSEYLLLDIVYLTRITQLSRLIITTGTSSQVVRNGQGAEF